MFRQPAVPTDSISFTSGPPRGPGIRVASPSTNRETFTVGISPAAALNTPGKPPSFTTCSTRSPPAFLTVALSLWVAPTINVDVYTQVRNQIQTRVPIRPE